MTSKTANYCIVQPHLLQRIGVLVLALLLSNGVVLRDAMPAVKAEENQSAAEETEPTTEEAESTTEEDAENSTEEAEPAAEESKSDESGSESAKSTQEQAPEESEQAKAESPEEGDNKDSASEEEMKKVAIENEKAKIDEAAGTEVEVIDDSEEEVPDEAGEEKPPVAKEPEKEPPKVEKRVIGASATIMETKSELLFRARVDTGAKSCSLHIEDMKIEDESDTMADNIGKVVRFKIQNGKDESHWLEAKIASYVIIKTSNSAEDRKRRYKVPLTFRYKDFEKTVLVTLNNRQHMEYPLLLGRNFLKGDFIVDVSLEGTD